MAAWPRYPWACDEQDPHGGKHETEETAQKEGTVIQETIKGKPRSPNEVTSFR